MERYFFHLRNDLAVDDEEGLECPNLEAARRQALIAARDVACANVREGHLDLDHFIIVAGEDGGERLRLTFREAVTVRG